MKRCGWVPEHDKIYAEYHDQEWGIPVFDDRKLFEMLILEGAQAGLSWNTILKKRANYRLVFDDFDAQKIADYDNNKISELMNNPGIIRNKLKISASIQNAQMFLKLQNEYSGFSNFIWQFVEGKPKVNSWKLLADIPVTTAESDAMSKKLKKQGFKFVGSTICYAFMQAVGMVNDHTVHCFRYSEVNNIIKNI